MKIIRIRKLDRSILRQAAEFLVSGFRELSPKAWPDLKSASREVRVCLAPDRICFGMVDKGVLFGWIGGIRKYGGHAWELHPLVVKGDQRLKGIGSSLVKALENEVRKRGGVTVFLGTDDETGRTTLANKDLYPDLCREISRIRNLRGHPFEFYLKNGYKITGVIPDANGPGKPDIFMAKRI